MNPDDTVTGPAGADSLADRETPTAVETATFSLG